MKKVIAQNSPMMKYILIATLIILLGFAIAYIYNIHETNEKFESKYNVVYIYSQTCPYCTKFQPVFDKWVEENKDTINVQAAHYEKSSKEGAMYAEKYSISGFPIVIVEKPDGSLADKQIGYVDFDSFIQFVKSAMMR